MFLHLFIQLHDETSQITVIFTVKSDRITHNSNMPFDFLIQHILTSIHQPLFSVKHPVYSSDITVQIHL
jgi:hypothetical protein